MSTLMKFLFGVVAALAVLILAHIDPAFAQAAGEAAPAATPAPPPSPINTGDTAWMLTSTALVLMMTIPGLALFYGGMVRKKNVLATVGQAFGATCIITVLWMVIISTRAVDVSIQAVSPVSMTGLAGSAAGAASAAASWASAGST